MSYQSYPVTIGAGKTERLALTGTYVACTAATLPTFNLGIGGGPLAEFRQGFFLQFDQPFPFLDVVNPATVPITIVLATGYGRFEDRRLLSNAPDGINPVTLADISEQGFKGTFGTTAVAGEYMHLQLWNPPDSGRLVVVRQIHAGSQTGGTISIGSHNAALANLEQSLTAAYVGGANGVTEIRYQGAAAVIPSSALFVLSIAVPTDGLQYIDMATPLVLPAGRGLIAWHQTTGANLILGADVLEIPGA